MNVPLIELHDRSLAVCNALGRDACTALLSTEKPAGGYDGTHLTPAGSMLMGAIVSTELKRVAPELAAHVRAVPAASAATRPATCKSAGQSFQLLRQDHPRERRSTCHTT